MKTMVVTVAKVDTTQPLDRIDMSNKQEYKGYLIEADGTFGQKTIKPVGKGSVHMSLRGTYTTVAFAQRAIDLYLGQKVESNGKAD